MEDPKYPKLTTELPAHVYARLHAAATVLKKPVHELVEAALVAHFATLSESKLELIDRVAASLLTRTEFGDDE